MSTGDDSMLISRIIILGQFLATIEALELYANNLIMLGRLVGSFRHLEC